MTYETRVGLIGVALGSAAYALLYFLVRPHALAPGFPWFGYLLEVLVTGGLSAFCVVISIRCRRNCDYWIPQILARLGFFVFFLSILLSFEIAYF